MNITRIKTKVDNLLQATQIEPFGLVNEAKQAWRDQVLLELSQLLATHLSEDELKQACREFLHRCFRDSLGSAVSYTAAPASPITKLLIELAREISPENPIAVLMPEVETTPKDSLYPNLKNEPIEQVLQTHMLSDDGLYLYPIEVLTREVEWSNRHHPPANPYYNASKEGNRHLSTREYIRMQSHSAVTEELFKAKELADFQKIQDQLKLSLIKRTYRGAEKRMLNFYLYSLLPSQPQISIDRITSPEGGMKLIKFLETLPDNESEIILRQTMDTLINTPDKRFVDAFFPHSNLLDNIKELKNFASIFSPQHQTILMQHFLPELINRSLHFNQVLKHSTEDERLLISEIMKTRLASFVKDAHDFQRIFQFLPTHYRAEMYTILKNRIPELIQSSGHFNQVFKHLNHEQRAEILNAIQDKLPTLFHSTEEQNRCLENLSLSNPTQVTPHRSTPK